MCEGEQNHILVAGEGVVLDFCAKVADGQRPPPPLHGKLHAHPLPVDGRKVRHAFRLDRIPFVLLR